MKLSGVIKIAKDFGLWIHDRTNMLNFKNDYKQNIALALLQQSMDVCDAIIVLVDSNLPGPALALARPMHEAYVRGVWLLNYASDEEVNAFENGKCPNFSQLLIEIGNDSETGSAWIHATTDLNLVSFHDLTHGGMQHVLRRVTNNSIEPNYPEEELTRLVQVGIETRIAIGVRLLALSNKLAELETLNVKAQRYRAIS